MCKTVFSALALGYPSPVIINWGVNHQDISHWRLGKALPKIPGLLHYLDSVMHPNATHLEKLEEEDIVIMIDARDVWFQLPAEVLLSRYHEINKRANERLLRQWTGSGPMPMKQTIVVGAQKKCYPNDPELFGVDLRCDIWPESPLRPDLYGPETDRNLTNLHDVRPRWLNGGMYIGPAGDMRRFFRRATEKMEAYIGEAFPLRSEQGMLGYLIGQQEVWRQWQRENRMKGSDLKGLIEENLEFHAGLDYAGELSSQVSWSDIDKEHDLYDGDFIALGDKDAIDRHSEIRGISPTRLSGVPEDIRLSQNPLAGFDKAANWSNMPLYTDFAIGTVPAMIHHNKLKTRRETWWDRPWYHQRLREIVTLRLGPRLSDEPLATIQVENTRIRYWAPSAESMDRYPRRANETATRRFLKMGFDELCPWDGKPLRHAKSTWWEEVFRDGGGRFR